MQVITPNNVKIYNLSAGKSLPDWVSERKKRAMLKKDTELRERIELIQDFEMPVVSSNVQMTPDGQYIFVTGVYKPRIKCFDVSQLSMKFERCFDSECVKLKVLSDDYSKVVFLHNDRYVEFHAQYGKYYRTRIPKFGNDLDYHYSTCDLYFVGTSNEIYRLNLEQGKYLEPLQTTGSENLCCQFNPVHDLFACGNNNGVVECWDPRAPKFVSLVDCKLDSYLDTPELKSSCKITALKYRDGLNLAVGTSTGHVLLYDIRSNKPILVKDHRYELPIKDIYWHDDSNNVISMDKRCCKIWDRQTGKPFTSIEPGTPLNNLCVAPNSGMLFMANEAPKVLVYYIPTLGPAPKWCSFLDNLTEELETNSSNNVYDDYKFVTKQELESIGLSYLIGSNLLRAYMHGYFMDIRLYRKAKQLSEPFNYEEYKRNKIKETLDKERINRVRVKKLPKVNTELAKKVIEEIKFGKNKTNSNIMEDDRFKSLFADPNYQIDKESEEYRLLNPVVQNINEKTSKFKIKFDEVSEDEDEDNEDGKNNDDDRSVSNDNSSFESSSEDEETWKNYKKKYNEIQKEKKQKNNDNKNNNNNNIINKNKDQTKQIPKFYELKEDLEYFSNNTNDILQKEKLKKVSIAKRMEIMNLNNDKNEQVIVQNDSYGNKQMTFLSTKAKRNEHYEKKAKEHHLERKAIRRSAGSIVKTFKKPNYRPRPK